MLTKKEKMVGVIFHWSPNPKLDFEGKRQEIRHMSTVAHAFPFLGKFGMVRSPDDDSLDDYLQRPFDSLEDALKPFEYYKCTPVYLHITGKPIAEIEHPESAVYIAGPDHGPLRPPQNALVVRLPLGGEIWACDAMAIALYDRMLRIRND